LSIFKIVVVFKYNGVKMHAKPTQSNTKELVLYHALIFLLQRKYV